MGDRMETTPDDKKGCPNSCAGFSRCDGSLKYIFRPAVAGMNRCPRLNGILNWVAGKALEAGGVVDERLLPDGRRITTGMVRFDDGKRVSEEGT